MKEQDKQEIRQIFNQGLEQLVLPILDDIYKEVGGIKKDVQGVKKDLKGVKKDVVSLKEDVSLLTNDVASINRKLDAEISWRDDASKRLKKVEVKLGFAK